MALSPSGAEIWRDYETDGVPSSGAKKPKKSEIRKWAYAIEQLLGSVTAAAAIFTTRATLYATLTYPANTLAWVVGDATAAYNGIYRKSGASGSGSWARVADLPYSFIIASDVGAGTPNAIEATSSIPVSGAALVVMNVFEANTGSPVTVSFNGGPALTMKTNTGNDIAAGGLAAGMRLFGIVAGSTFRLINDQVSGAIVAAAESAQVAAEAARDLAAGYAAGVHLPPVLAGDEGKILEVKPDHSGFQLIRRISDAEALVYADKAAVLDPACHVYVQSGAWSVTVPEYETWYILNMWMAQLPSTAIKLFHREADANRAMEVTSGFSLIAGDMQSFIYYARPKLVKDSDVRYTKDPRGLYYDRLARLKSLETLTLEVSRPQGTVYATNSQVYIATPDFDRGMVKQWQCHDGAWLGMLGAGNNIINTQNERSDKFPQRLTSGVLFPFNTSQFSGLWLMNGSEGDYTQNFPQAYPGYGAMHYVKLPSDW